MRPACQGQTQRSGWVRGRAESEGQGLSGREERGGGVGLGGVEQGSMPEEDQEALWRACRR